MECIKENNWNGSVHSEMQHVTQNKSKRLVAGTEVILQPSER
jgi:hypothetical protein